MDGFKIWKNLYEKGFKGIIRRDEGFGFRTVSSPLTVKYNTGLGTCLDYANLKNYLAYGLEEQVLPEHLVRLEGESLPTWRDRDLSFIQAACHVSCSNKS